MPDFMHSEDVQILLPSKFFRTRIYDAAVVDENDYIDKNIVKSLVNIDSNSYVTDEEAENGDKRLEFAD